MTFKPDWENAGKVSDPTHLKSSNHNTSKSRNSPWFQNDIILLSLKIKIIPSKSVGLSLMPDRPLA
jgi:hypothetical protein